VISSRVQRFTHDFLLLFSGEEAALYDISGAAPPSKPRRLDALPVTPVVPVFVESVKSPPPPEPFLAIFPLPLIRIIMINLPALDLVNVAQTCGKLRALVNRCIQS
jgi:hypothetical protein